MVKLEDILQISIGFFIVIIIIMPLSSIYAQINTEEAAISSEPYERVETDLRIDMNGDGRIEDNDNIPEEDEPGKYISYNNDYDLDQTNNKADWEWEYNQKVMERFNQEDEFCKVHMNLFPHDQAGDIINTHIKKGVLQLERENLNIRVWWKDDIDNKYKRVLYYDKTEYWNLEINDPLLKEWHSRDFYEYIKEKLYVEGIQDGSCKLIISYYEDFEAFKSNDEPEHSDSLMFNIIKVELDGLKVYDPKLESAGNAIIKYTIQGPLTGFTPRLELTIMDGTIQEVACLVRKDESSPALGAEIIKSWDGKWGMKTDGSDTMHKGKFADPKKYTVILRLYESELASTNLFSKEYNLYVVRLGIAELSFEDASKINEEFDLMYHLTKSTDTSAGAVNDFPLNDPVWKIGPDIPCDLTDKGDVDKKDGTYRPESPPHNLYNFPEQDIDDPDQVEDDNFNRPVCYRVGSRPQIRVKMGSQAVSQLPGNSVINVGYGKLSSCPNIKLEPFNYKDDPDTVGDNENIQPNQEYYLEAKDTAILGQNGRVTNDVFTIDMKFYYKDRLGWMEIPGYQRTTHILYLVWNAPCGLMTKPWVKVLHCAIQWTQPINHTHNLGGGVTQGPESHQPDSEENIAQNLMWYLSSNLHWNFNQGDPADFEERWRRLIATDPAVTYDSTDAMDEPSPVSGILGGDCKTWAHVMSDLLTAVGIGPYGPDFVNENPEDNFDIADPWGGGFGIPNRLHTDGFAYFRGIYGGGAFNVWQGVCKSGTGATCYSAQGPHMAIYDIMNKAPTAPPFNQPFDNIHAFEWYLWVRPRLPSEGAPYPAGYGEVAVGGTVYVYCLNIPNP